VSKSCVGLIAIARFFSLSIFEMWLRARTRLAADIIKSSCQLVMVAFRFRLRAQQLVQINTSFVQRPLALSIFKFTMNASDILHLVVPGRAPRAKAVARRSAVATSDDILKLARVGQRGQRGRALQKKNALQKQEIISQRRLAAQTYNHDRRGFALTADHYLCARGPRQSPAAKGRSKFRRWTPEAILRAADMAPTAACRSDRTHKASNRSFRLTRMVVADVVFEAQAQGLKAVCDASRSSPLEYWITNTMSDETKLPFGKHTPRKRRCLAWHSQCTWRVADGDKDIDVDIIRPPRLLQAYTAANCWDLLGEKNDSASLCPEGDALPEAMYHARLTATDSHTVNKLVSKFAANELPENHFHVAAYCTQHRTGSVCEEVSKRWGLLSPAFCLATQLEHGDFIDSLRTSVVEVLRKFLHCVDHLDVVVEEYEYGADEARRLRDFAEELIRVCYVQNFAGNDEGDDQPQTKRSERADAFISFPAALDWDFAPPVPSWVLLRPQYVDPARV
jgi:hypothetical protein